MKVFFFVDVRRENDGDRGFMCAAIDALSEQLETMHDELHENQGIADRGRADFEGEEFAGSIHWMIDDEE